MKMKKWTALLLVFSLLTLLTACSNQNNRYYGDKPSNGTLRVCVDSWYTDPALDKDREYHSRLFFEALAQEIKSACGIEKLTFEILPCDSAERETALQRLRTEIMAGEGPDVFIMQSVTSLMDGVQHRDALFNFPEKNMESGIFLPLDEYMSNTQFTDWNAQTKAVMDAGRNDEGQLIVPMTYKLPVLIYPKSEADIARSAELTMQDILDDPKTAQLGAALYSSLNKTDSYNVRALNDMCLTAVLGQLADYEQEELLFTAEELSETLNTMLSLHDAAEANPLQYINTFTSYNFMIYDLYTLSTDTEMTLVPLYSTDGGVTATITAYAAVNRNTAYPEKAFSVIDYIMQEKTQRESELYTEYFNDGLPMQNDLGSEKKTLWATMNPQRFLEEPYFKDLLSIKEEITAVNFMSEFDIILEGLAFDSVFDDSFSDETISEAYEKMERMVGE